MVVGLGVDIMDVERMAAELRAGDAGFLPSVFTRAEVTAWDGGRQRARRYAACFAAKEAALKALAPDGEAGIGWTDIEVLPGPAAAPALTFHRAAAAVAARRGITRCRLSVSCTRRLALATVVLESPS
jgi:holo-[acyl-carrier protein] synthase